MKKMARKLLALMLILGVLAPQAVMASNVPAGSTCYITVTVQDDQENNKVSAVSSRYLTGNAPLAAEVVALVHQKYDELTIFQSPAMKAIMDEGLTAFTKTDADWTAYLNQYFSDVTGDSLKNLIKNKNATLGDLTPNTVNTMSFTNDVVSDAKYGVTYTVSIVLTVNNDYDDDDDDDTPGSGSGPVIKPTEKPEEKPTVKPGVLPSTGILNDPTKNGVADLLTLEHIAYMAGDAQGTFRPGANITRKEAAQLFYNLLVNKDVDAPSVFEDVPEGQWYTKAVNTIAALGIITGDGNGHFFPDQNVTRAQFVTMAAKFAKAVDSDVSFTDVPANHWAYQFIKTAVGYGWVGGYPDNTFGPDKPITRAETVQVINKMLGRSVDKDFVDANLSSLKTFPDTKTHWAFYSIFEATNAHSHSYENGVEKWSR